MSPDKPERRQRVNGRDELGRRDKVRGQTKLSWRSAAQKRRYSKGMDLVERRLTEVAERYPGALGDACRATLGAGGKRVRPLLTLLSSRRDVPFGPGVVHAAAAVELLHMATLVHDDVLDHAELRRGRPTVMHEFGVEVAVSAGNYLLASAFRELCGTGDARAVDILSASAVGLSEGEVLQRREAFDVAVDVAAYERRCERKTADLFAAACRLGALLSGLDEEAERTLAEYGRLLGLAFQVFDDILDVSGDEARTGKRLGTDIRDGTVTLPVIYALEQRPELGPRLQRRPVEEDTVDLILAEIVGSGAVDRAREHALGYILKSGDLLMALDAEIDEGLLVQVAVQIVDRYS